MSARHPWLQSTASAKRASMLADAERVHTILKGFEGSDDVATVLIAADIVERMHRSAMDLSMLEQFFATEYAREIAREIEKLKTRNAELEMLLRNEITGADTQPPIANDTRIGAAE